MRICRQGDDPTGSLLTFLVKNAQPVAAVEASGMLLRALEVGTTEQAVACGIHLLRAASLQRLRVLVRSQWLFF